jgi:6-phosphogluconolactonase
MHFDHRLLNRSSRRAFLRSTASLAALTQFRWIANAAVAPRQKTLAYAAFTRNTESEDGSLQVFSLHGKRWSPIQTVPSRAPACVLLSQNRKTLYVANRVAVYEGLPRGTVEAFSIDPSDGRVRLLNRQTLSLSATHPQHMALSPNGNLLAVSADGGAIHNLLPISADGSLDRPASIFKQCGSHTGFQAEQRHYKLLFDPTGDHLFSSTFANEQISIFAIAQSPTSHRMQQRLAELDDPGAYAFHPNGSMFYMRHERKSSLSCYRYDTLSGRIGETLQQISIPTYRSDAVSLKALAVHPSGRMLYTTQTTRNRMQAWHIDVHSGHLSHAKNIDFDNSSENEITVTPNGDNLFVSDRLSGEIHRIPLDTVTGEPGLAENAAIIYGAQSIVIKTL